MSVEHATQSADVVAAATARALEILRQNTSMSGLQAGGGAYPEVWARDAVITGLGLAAINNSASMLSLSLQSLAAVQSRLGRIPNHVFAPGDRDELVPDTVFAGAVDASLWFILGNYVDSASTVDWNALTAAYQWLEYQDSNECGLLEVHESMDWADLFANRYNSLLPNVLWYAANKAMGSLASRNHQDSETFNARAEDIRYKINQLLWVGPEIQRDTAWIADHRAEWLYPVRLVDTVLIERPYYLPYMAFRDYGDRCDTFGNLLAILFGVADPVQTDRILDYIHEVGIDRPWPVKAAWPVVMPGDSDWREYYRNYNLNLPDQYHNGGAWPFLGGFYVAALAKAGRHEHAEQTLVRLALMNRESRRGTEWEFNEWFHGQSGRPMGHVQQSWSAGMFLYAAEAVKRKSVPFFDDNLGWQIRPAPASRQRQQS